MPVKTSPADWVQRWKAGVGAAGSKYTQGVQQSADWASAATAPAAVNARNQGLQRAMANGSIERGIQNVGTAGWRASTLAKSGNWQVGVNSPVAAQRAQAGAQRLYGMLTNADAAIANMPRGGFNENVQRLTTYITSMHSDAQAQKGNG